MFLRGFIRGDREKKDRGEHLFSGGKCKDAIARDEETGV